MATEDSNQSIFDAVYRQGNFAQLHPYIETHRQERQRFLDSLVACLPSRMAEPARMLEVGCGTAIDSYIVAERAACLACGIDLSRDALRIAGQAAQHFSSRLGLLAADALRLPFRDESFDLVFSQGVLEHFTDPDLAIVEQLRVLKSGGKLVINVPQKYTAYTLAKHYRIRCGTWPWGYESEFSYGRLRRLGRRFHLIETGVMGCRYWLHPCEPMWVLRSLGHKLQKFNPARHTGLCRVLTGVYERGWEQLERRFGHHFMQDIVIIFKKP